MHTRSARNEETGLFTVECHDWHGALFFRGEFADMREADDAGADAERKMTIAMQAGEPKPLDDLLAEMDDMALLLELGVSI